MILSYKIYSAVQFSVIFFTRKNYSARVLSTLANAEVLWVPVFPAWPTFQFGEEKAPGILKETWQGTFYKDM